MLAPYYREYGLDPAGGDAVRVRAPFSESFSQRDGDLWRLVDAVPTHGKPHAAEAKDAFGAKFMLNFVTALF